MYKTFVIPSSVWVWLLRTKLSKHPRMSQQLQDQLYNPESSQERTGNTEQEKAFKWCSNGMMIIQHVEKELLQKLNTLRSEQILFRKNLFKARSTITDVVWSFPAILWSIPLVC